MVNNRENFFTFLKKKKLKFFKKKFPDTCFIKQDYIVIDFETTGFYANKGDKIIAIGGLKVKNGELERGSEFYSLVNPLRDIPDVVQKLTGIKNQDVEGERIIEEVFPEFIKWAESGIICGHAIEFDISFVRKLNLDKLGSDLFDRYFDTRELIGLLYPNLKNKNLFQIAEYLELKILKEHNALEDAVLAAEILQICLQEFKNNNMNTLESIENLMKSRNLVLPSHYN